MSAVYFPGGDRDRPIALPAEPEAPDLRCGCPHPVEGDGSPCMYFVAGYPWCRSCGEHHRPPECAVNAEGQSLAADGTPWTDLGMPTDKDKGLA